MTITAWLTTSTTTRLAGIAKDKLKQWSDELGWETLLNRAGTTFRKLPDSDKEGLNERKALALMLAQPSMIKRPVLDLGGKLLVGFKPDVYGKEVPAKSQQEALDLITVLMVRDGFALLAGIDL